MEIVHTYLKSWCGSNIGRSAFFQFSNYEPEFRQTAGMFFADKMARVLLSDPSICEKRNQTRNRCAPVNRELPLTSARRTGRLPRSHVWSNFGSRTEARETLRLSASYFKAARVLRTGIGEVKWVFQPSGRHRDA